MNEQTFDEYWQVYLSGHSRLSTRIIHYIGLIFGPLLGVYFSIMYQWWAFFVTYPVFYSLALVTHSLFEQNTNKPFASRAAWSVVSLFKMLWLDITGQISCHLERIGRG